MGSSNFSPSRQRSVAIGAVVVGQQPEVLAIVVYFIACTRNPGSAILEHTGPEGIFANGLVHMEEVS